MTVAPLAERREHAESAHRKKVQAGLSTAAGTIGLSGLGALIGSKALKRSKLPKRVALGEKLGSGATQAAVVGGGVGALSSLNFANLSRKEAKKEKELSGGVKPMNNKSLTSKSLSGIVQEYSVSKGFLRSPGGFSRSHLARTPTGKMVSRRGYLTPTRRF